MSERSGTITNKDLHGVVPALVLPLTAGGEVDDHSLRSLASRVAGTEGVTAVVVNALAGEGPLLDEDTGLHVVKSVVEELAGAVPVLAGISAESSAVACRRLERTAERGAAGALVS